MKPRVLDHIGVAVPSIDDASAILGPLIVGEPRGREVVAGQGVEVAFLGGDIGAIELLAPTRPDSPIARHLERRGPGLHHICYRVADIEAAIAQARADGYTLIDEVARTGAHGHQVAFLHPKATAGVLIELVQHEAS